MVTVLRQVCDRSASSWSKPGRIRTRSSTSAQQEEKLENVKTKRWGKEIWKENVSHGAADESGSPNEGKKRGRQNMMMTMMVVEVKIQDKVGEGGGGSGIWNGKEVGCRQRERVGRQAGRRLTRKVPKWARLAARGRRFDRPGGGQPPNRPSAWVMSGNEW